MPEGLEPFLRIRARLKDVGEHDGWLFGRLELQQQEAGLAKDLAELRENGVIPEIRQKGELVFPGTWESGTLELKIDSGRLPGYFEDYDSLIANYPDEPPQELFVWDKDAKKEDGYRATCALLLLLKGKVEVWDSTQRRFFLVDQQAIEIPLGYRSRQTAPVGEFLPKITKFLDAEHLDADVRWTFFRKASIRLLRDVVKDERLGRLLEDIGNVLERARQDYALYLERFSFEDLIKTFDEKRLKFVGDLNQVLASIQTALIGVPIAFFLIAEKFKPADGFIGQNLILAVGGIVFFALLFVLSLNQGKTLAEIRRALAEFETEQTKKHTDKSERLRTLINEARAHHRRVARLLLTVRCLLVLFALVIATALLWCSIPAWQKELPYLPLTAPTNSPALPQANPPTKARSF